MTFSCMCGHVRLVLDEPPKYINECNCSLCRKAGARWGYFPPDAVGVVGPTTPYRRADRLEPNAEVHFCASCGSTTHFVLTQSAVAKFGAALVGVNMQLADESDLRGVEVRYPDGKTWSGVGAFGYVRAATRIS